jgi:ATP-dependent DNA helicase RecQ
VRRAISFLRRDHRPISPRKRWAPDAVVGLNGNIKPPNEPGVALAIYRDAGWGRSVSDARQAGGSLDEGLIGASANLIADTWAPTAEEGWWVTSVPSRRRPRLVGDAARAIAERLGLPYREDVLAVAGDAPPQSDMQNGAMKLRNVDSALEVATGALPGPVILIDDLVDSGWTLTLAGHLLRTNGSGAVHPFVFAEVTGGLG